MRNLLLQIPIPIALSACATASEQNLMSEPEQVLLSQMRDACGGESWHSVEGWHETGQVELPNGMAASYEAWSDTRALKTASRAYVGEMQLRHVGFDGSAFWSVGQDGIVTTDNGPETVRKQLRDAYISSHAYFLPDRFPADFQLAGERIHEGRSYIVLRVTPINADGVDLWVDPASFLVRRMVADQESVELDDYTFFHGVCTATTGVQRGTNAAETLTLHIETVAIGAQPRDTFTAPD